MSCKYCRGGEPLLDEGGVTLRIDGACAYRKASIALTDGEETMRQYIDYCPVCGDELRPFGPAWMHP